MAITAEDVSKIITTSLDVDSFITIASCIIDQYDLSSCYSDQCIDEIHKYLTAHLIAVSDKNNRVVAKGIDTAKDQYQNTVSAPTVLNGGGLQATIYGQTVAMFDKCNILVDLGKSDKKTIVFASV